MFRLLRSLRSQRHIRFSPEPSRSVLSGAVPVVPVVVVAEWHQVQPYLAVVAVVVLDALIARSELLIWRLHYRFAWAQADRAGRQ